MALVNGNPFDDSLAATARWVEPTTSAIAHRLLDELDLPAGARVLDLGTGTGSLAVAAAERGYVPTAIDTAPMLTDYVAGRLRHWPAASAELMDATTLTYPDAAFDAVFSIFTVMYLRDGVPAALAEARRVLRPGGAVAITHWPSPKASSVIRALLEASEDIGEELPFPLDYTAHDDLVRAVAAAGFSDIEVTERESDYAFPPADEVYWEFQPFFVMMPFFRAMPPHRRAELESAMIARAQRVERGELERPALTYNLVTARAA